MTRIIALLLAVILLLGCQSSAVEPPAANIQPATAATAPAPANVNANANVNVNTNTRTNTVPSESQEPDLQDQPQDSADAIPVAAAHPDPSPANQEPSASQVGSPSEKPPTKPTAPSKKTERAATPSKVADWPNWMGPNWDGVSHEKGWSTQWPKQGLPVAWSRQLGTGFSSVSIAKGRLFSMGHAQGQETIYCLNLTDGKDVWTKQYEAPLVNNLHEGGPGATPTVEGEFVYTVSKGGRLLCLRVANGEIVWSVELQQELQVDLPEWGFNGSPYILGKMLILEAGRVVAFDKTSGKKHWQTNKHTAGYGSVTHFVQGGRTYIASFDCDGLRIVDAKDGTEIAFERWDSPFDTNSTTPIMVDGKIFISSAYNVGCGLFELRDGKLELIYDNRDMRNHFNNSILYQGHLYGFDGNSNLGRVVHLKCMNAQTGEILWKKRGLGCGSLMIANGRLVLLSERGELVIADATPADYRELSRASILQGRCWTVPVLHGGRVYARNARGRLVCVELPREN